MRIERIELAVWIEPLERWIWPLTLKLVFIVRVSNVHRPPAPPKRALVTSNGSGAFSNEGMKRRSAGARGLSDHDHTLGLITTMMTIDRMTELRSIGPPVHTPCRLRSASFGGSRHTRCLECPFNPSPSPGHLRR